MAALETEPRGPWALASHHKLCGHHINGITAYHGIPSLLALRCFLPAFYFRHRVAGNAAQRVLEHLTGTIAQIPDSLD